MMKKFFMFVFTIFVSVIFVNQVDAKRSYCYYYDETDYMVPGGLMKMYSIIANYSGDFMWEVFSEYIEVDIANDPLHGYMLEGYTIDVNITETNPACPGTINISESEKKITDAGNSGQYKLINNVNLFYKFNQRVEGEPNRLCTKYIKEESCNMSKSIGDVSCVWNSLGEDESGNDIGFCSTSNLTYVSCGDAIDVPSEVPRISSLAVTILKTGAAIVLIIMGTLTLLKAIYSSKEDEIKKAQSSFIKKLIAAALVFFVVSIVQFVVLRVADTGTGGEDAGLKECLSCFLNHDCNSVTYYKNVDAEDNETCFKLPTAPNVTPAEITCPTLPSN